MYNSISVRVQAIIVAIAALLFMGSVAADATKVADAKLATASAQTGDCGEAFRGCMAGAQAARDTCLKQNSSSACAALPSAVFEACTQPMTSCKVELSAAVPKAKGKAVGSAATGKTKQGYEDEEEGCTYFCEPEGGGDDYPPGGGQGGGGGGGGYPPPPPPPPQMGSSCMTPVGACPMYQQGTLGYPCYCVTPWGPVGGQIGR